MKYYVKENAEYGGNGSLEKPFRHIQEAADIAAAGDEIIVGDGIYREYVDPKNSGENGYRRIVYRAEHPGKAVITGAEIVKGWEKANGQAWVTRVDNRIFGNYNPYQEKIFGDWFVSDMTLHTGEVYLNGKSLFEASSLVDVENGVCYDEAWDTTFADRRWYAEVGEFETVIYANFKDADPNAECVEINVRRRCFFPSNTGVNYITLSGFKVRQAATTWAPPTAFQDGMIGPHWAKFWIMENLEVSDSKCSGISLGKVYQPNNDNRWMRFGRKHGTQNERDNICEAWKFGWSKEEIGHHIVRNCEIHDCEQTGIVGHLGCIFSLIENNHIHHINTKQQLHGAEIACIKLHAAIDTVIRRNHFHHATRGLWLDWQGQGTRVSQNLFHDNVKPSDSKVLTRNDVCEDLFIEISHGPTIVDNNILLSPYASRISTQGVAYINNLIYGSFIDVGYGHQNGGGYSTLGKDYARYTPYHDHHSTTIMGFMSLLHGDMRFYNNIFVQNPADYDTYEKIFEGAKEFPQRHAGTVPYNEYPTGEEFEAKVSNPNFREIDRYYEYLPVWYGGNVYMNGAKPCDKETDAKLVDSPVSLTYSEDGFKVTLQSDLFEKIKGLSQHIYETEDLGLAFEPEQRFEAADGSDIIFDTDFFGNKSEKACIPGPFASVEGFKEGVVLSREDGKVM